MIRAIPMPERDIQRQLVAELSNRFLTNGPALAFHVPNGIPLPHIDGRVRARIWNAMVRDGARTGAADLVVIHDGKVHFVELKSVRGAASDAQKAFREEAAACGVTVHTVRGLEAARNLFRQLGVMKCKP